jgi:glycosyltransferase involved in cell wall biosynthesis
VNPENVFEIMRATHRVLVDQLLRDKLKARGYEQSKRFSWDSSVRRILKVYEEVGGGTTGSENSPENEPRVQSLRA